MSLNQQETSSNSSFRNSGFRNGRLKACKFNKRNAINLTSTLNKSNHSLINSSTISTTGDHNIDLVKSKTKRITNSNLSNEPCDLTAKVITNLNKDVLSNLPTSSFSDLSMLSPHSYDTPQNLSTHQSTKPPHPQQYKVGQKNSQFYLMPTTNHQSATTVAIEQHQLLNEFGAMHHRQEKRMLDSDHLSKELVELKRLALQLERKVNGRPNDFDLAIRQE